MSNNPLKRRLTTILAADVVGYSRLMAKDEAGTLGQLKANRRELIDPKVEEHRGRLIKLMGDGMLLEFESVTDAVEYSLDVQASMRVRNENVPPEGRIVYRIGINTGDVVVEGDDIYGNGVNVAARLEGIAPPGGLAISDDVFRLLSNDLSADWSGGDVVEVKNIDGGIKAWFWSPGNTSASEGQLGTKSSLRETHQKKPSIFVLPFATFSSDQELEFLGDGLVDDLLTNLQRFRLLTVNSRTSSFQYKTKRAHFAEVARETGADYMIEGSLRRAGNMVRVNAQLIEASSDRHLWADRFERSMDDPFHMQDEVATAITAAVEPVLVEAINRSGRLSRADVDSRSPLKRAGWHLFRFTQEDNATAIGLLEEAIRENPNADRRYQALSMGHMWDLTFCWTKDVDASTRRALEAAETAVSVGPKDSWNYTVLGWSLVYAGDISRSRAALNRAIELNPNSGVPYGVLAWASGHYIDTETAIAALDKSLQLAPDNPFVFQYLNGGSLAYYKMGDYETSLATAESSALRRPNSIMAHVLKTASLFRTGNISAAKFEVAQLRELLPAMTAERLTCYLPVRDDEVARSLIDGLRSSGF
ncbi:adenylate/guanylate cyclase domain-containing protein [Lutimaribacter marinistellae]|uniref:Adenylate/guanylate cyclase domain-containing protein n=1 Tax=Lutimaribacter marinistellae TaxID=1820329 RepID=A0ABV7THJ1_9RHOB